MLTGLNLRMTTRSRPPALWGKQGGSAGGRSVRGLRPRMTRPAGQIGTCTAVEEGGLAGRYWTEASGQQQPAQWRGRRVLD